MGDTDVGDCAWRAAGKSERRDALVAVRSWSSLVYLVVVALSRRLELDSRDTAGAPSVCGDCELCLDFRSCRFVTRRGAVRCVDGEGKYCEAATLPDYRAVFGFCGIIGIRQDNRCE